MATLPKVLISRADYQIGGGVALGLRTQGVEQVQHMLEEDWWHGATFSSYHRQCDSLHLKVWESPPCCCDEDDIDDDADDIHGNKPALKLLQEMLDLGISRWHPDPLAAIEAAKRKHRKVS